MNLESIRKEYKHSVLSHKNLNKNPFRQFDSWIKNALQSEIEYSNAMSLITVGTDGFPQSRIVLLKNYDESGFTFFTNFESEKGISIKNNSAVGLHFFWPELERQIRISGFAEKTSNEISEEYFKSRPVESQIAAIVSNQSKEISTRENLENKFENLKSELLDKPPARPQNWGGYIVKPVKFEFWQGRENRLHDRIIYLKKEKNWEIKRLAP